MKYFCSKCGKTTQYNFELPNFCSSCGQSFASKSPPIKSEEQRNKFLNELKLKKNINPLKIQGDLEDAEEYSVESNIDFKKIKPSFKVDVYKNPGESFGSIIENPSKPVDIEPDTPQKPKTRQEILAEFQKEAGSLRPE